MKKILFIAILLIAVGLRFTLLNSVPPSASLDEATIGWNAYSILHTGRDEYGYFLPVLLRAYDDYRPALYVYTVIPFVKIFGLSVIAVRLPSVILSLATVIMTFFLTKNLFIQSKRREIVAFVAMFLLAVSPWHVYTSRLGHEVNLGLTVVVASLLLFFLAINKKSNVFLILSFFGFAISFYTYQTEKIFTPLLLIALFVIFGRQLFAMKKYTIIGILIFGLVSIPIFFASLSPGALLRLKGTSVFSDNPLYVSSARQILVAKNKGNTLGIVLNNRRFISAEIFTKNYFSHFNPWWLFGNSGNEQFKAPQTGLLYLWELPFLLLGILYLFIAKDINKKVKITIFIWIFASFVAPGITTGAPHAMRAFVLLPLPQIITALGLLYVLSFVKKYKGIYMGIIVLVSVIALQQCNQFMYQYFIVFPISQSASFQYALKNTMEYVEKNKMKYEKVVISNRDSLYQSYMFYLFYSKYDPARYLKNGGTKSGGFQETHTIDSIVFRPIDWENEEMRNTLFVGNPADFSDSSHIVYISYYLNGVEGVKIVKK